MKTIEIDGKSYLIDIEKATEQGLLKERDSKPRSWKEYSDIYEEKVGHYTNASDIDIDAQCKKCRCYDSFNSDDEAKAFCALGKLIQLRDAWWGEWRPKWNIPRYTILCFYNELCKDMSTLYSEILSFPTSEMRDDFLNTFRDMIEQAKMFL